MSPASVTLPSSPCGCVPLRELYGSPVKNKLPANQRLKNPEGREKKRAGAPGRRTSGRARLPLSLLPPSPPKRAGEMLASRLHAAVSRGLKPPWDRHPDPGSRPPALFQSCFAKAPRKVGHTCLQRQPPQATSRGARSPYPMPRGRKRVKGSRMKTRAFSSCSTVGLCPSQPTGTRGSSPGHCLCSVTLHKLPSSAR